MEMVEEEEGHTPLEMVQPKMFIPKPRAVTPEDGRLGVVTLPPPDTKLHEPVPIPGIFPFSAAAAAQTVCDAPALDKVGFRSLWIETVEEEGGQDPLEIVH